MKKYQVKIRDELNWVRDVDVRAPSIAQAPKHAAYLVGWLTTGTVASVSRNGKVLGVFERTAYGEWVM